MPDINYKPCHILLFTYICSPHAHTHTQMRTIHICPFERNGAWIPFTRIIITYSHKKVWLHIKRVAFTLCKMIHYSIVGLLHSIVGCRFSRFHPKYGCGLAICIRWLKEAERQTYRVVRGCEHRCSLHMAHIPFSRSVFFSSYSWLSSALRL